MAITSVAQMAAAPKQRIHFARAFTGPSTSSVNARGSSYVDVQAGGVASGAPKNGTPSAAYTAGSGYTYSSASTGAMQLVNAVNTNRVHGVRAMANQNGYFTLADRLWACSGMGFAAATYTVTTPGSLPARITDSGVGCEIWITGSEVNNAAATAPAGSLTVNYLNTNGDAKASVVSAADTWGASSLDEDDVFRMPLEAGDRGVSQIVSVVLGSSWTAGNFGVEIVKPVFGFGLRSNAPKSFTWKDTGLPVVHGNACLFFIGQGSAASLRATIDLVDL